MKIVAHPDPFVLERELLDSLAAAGTSDPLAPLLVLVPTGRLAGHLQRRLLEERSSWLNVEITHFGGAARRILEAAGEQVPRVLPLRLQEALLRKVLDAHELEENRWKRFVELRPGALRALQSTFTDLREACITPEELREGLHGRSGDAGLARIYARYVDELERLMLAEQLADHAALLGRAALHAERYAGRYLSIWLHGAYELIGANLDLLRALDGGDRVTVLLPASAREGAPATAYARRYAETYLLQEGNIRSAEAAGRGGLLGSRLEALYDELAAPPPFEADKVSFRDFQGGMSEVEWAVREAMRAVTEGTSPLEIGIVARSLREYAPLLEAAFGSAGISWSSSTGTPLRREPVIHDLLVLLRILAEDFPRAPTAELLGSPHVRWEKLSTRAAPPEGDLAEAWSRSAGILGGVDEWSSTLVEWASEPGYPDGASDDDRDRIDRYTAWKRARAEELARAVKLLRSRYRGRQPSSWSGHADWIEMIVRDLLPGCGAECENDAALGKLLELLRDMRRLDAIGGSGGKVPFPKALEWFEGAIDETELPAQAEGLRGIQVLDAMQARGLTFRRLFVLGFHSGQFPRVPREDPFLADDTRRHLREAAGRPLPVKEEGEDEEHLLLSILLGSAGERVDLSWQRADDTGRALSPSLALREVARLVLGRPDYRVLVNDLAMRTAADPLLRLEATLSASGMLSPTEERLLLALRGDGPESVAARLAERSPELERGLRMLIATESFAPGAGEYDGRVGDAAPLSGPLSASALGTLGSCPLLFFFERVLHLHPLDEEQSAFDLLPNEIGLAVHAILESIYRRLLEEELLPGGPAEAAIDRALELLEPAWRERTAAMRRRIGARLGALWSAHESGWLRALVQFLESDIPRVIEFLPDGVDLEKSVASEIDLGEGVRIDAAGRFDRLLRRGGECLVSDYKTSGNIRSKTDVTEMLKGRSLQVPVYSLLAGGAAVELLGVGPSYELDDDGRPESSFFEGIEGRQLEGLRETLRELAGLRARGLYPINPPDACGWCPYTTSCRNNHAPTMEREARAPDAAGFRDLKLKNKSKKPLLADLRHGSGREEEQER